MGTVKAAYLYYFREGDWTLFFPFDWIWLTFSDALGECNSLIGAFLLRLSPTSILWLYVAIWLGGRVEELEAF